MASADSGPRRSPPLAVPTLTEVIDAFELPSPVAAADAASIAGIGVVTDAGSEPPADGWPVHGSVVLPELRLEPSAEVSSGADHEQLVQRVLLEIQRHVDLMVEYRLREALGPVLARAADAIVTEARLELGSTLRDVVSRAVAQELGRQRQR